MRSKAPRPGGESRRRYENPLSFTAREGSSPSARTTPPPCSSRRETAGHHAPAPAPKDGTILTHALDGRYRPPHPHFLSAPQRARVIFLTVSELRRSRWRPSQTTQDARRV